MYVSLRKYIYIHNSKRMLSVPVLSYALILSKFHNNMRTVYNTMQCTMQCKADSAGSLSRGGIPRQKQGALPHLNCPIFV